MPVSTFSAGSHAVRSGHGAMIARWNSTRDKLAADERRTSMSEITEMDGTGLHERPNWPLMDDDRNVSQQQRSVSPVERGGQESVVEDAVVRRSEDVGSPGPDATPWADEEEEDEGEVSDMEENEDDANLGAEPTLGPDARQRLQNHLSMPPDAMPDLTPVRSEVSEIVTPTADGSRQISPANHAASNNLQSPAVQPPEVSPMRGEWPSPRSPQSQASRSPQSPRSISHGFQSSPMNGYHSDRPSSEAESSRRPSQVTADEVDEARDVATPIPWSRDDATQRSMSPALSQTNGMPASNGHARVSSMAKTLPLSRSTSRASNHPTTHIPSNKDRVRYSWQSLHDDEPNRPRIHIIKLVSEVATASAGFPGGEAFGFSISPGGRRIAAYNSARLYVLQTAALPVGISQDYALKRRPLAVEIVDDGDVMAILADEHTINIYDLGHQRLRRTKTIKTDFPTNCIALAPTGGLIAAAYEGGVEIFSLDPSALPTDRRAVRSQRMDRLTFSEDGSTLLGTTTRINVSSTMVVSVPVYPVAANGIATHQELKEAWCSELLHPENIRNSSHGTFMREDRHSCNDRIFSWNGGADTFGILSVEDMQYGNIDFPVVISPPLSTCGGLGAAIHSCPAIDEHGDTVAMIVNDRTIRLYIVPHKSNDDESTVEAHSIDHELDEGYGCPFNEAKWVYSSATLPAPLTNQTQVQGRLIVTSPGGVVEQSMNGEEMVDDIEGGRIILFDFDPQFAGQPGQTFSLTLGKSPSQLLEEEKVDVADEVALVRRRTVNQSKSGGLSQRPITLGRSATTFNSGPRTLRSASPAFNVRSNRASMLSMNSMQSEAARSLPDLVESPESGEAAGEVEEPYAQNAPRSHASLQRAASNAQRHRYQTLEERTQERVSVDSNGGFLPLPEYTEEPNAPLPSRFRAMAGLDAPPQPPPKPAIQTSMNGAGGGPSGTAIAAQAPAAPSTAPASMADTFSAEEAFRTATATYSAAAQQQRQDAVAAAMQSTSNNATPIPRSQTLRSNGSVQPPQGPSALPRSETFSSMTSMPRSLQRAYSNAISPLGSGPPPSLIGDWANVSPVTRANTSTNASINGNSSHHSPASTLPENEAWDAIAPVGQPSRYQTSSPFSRAREASNPYRHSTSLLNPPGHSGVPNRMPSNASYNPMSPTSPQLPASAGGMGVSTGRRMPPHMQAFRNAAASASLFPPTQESDHVPLPPPPAKAGSVAHPITAWHPPAASASLPPPSAKGHTRKNSGRGHSRQSSFTNRSAFASTEKAKKLGFFKRRKERPMVPGGYPQDEGGGGDSLMETRSVMTWMTKGESLIGAFTMTSLFQKLTRPFTTATTRFTPEQAAQLSTMPEGAQKATLAAGCFWGIEHMYRHDFGGKGLLDARVGYIGGDQKNPTYRAVCSGRTGHAEACQIVFNPEELSYRTIIEYFYKMHDPTTSNRQGPDVGSQYRSGIFYHDEEQKKIAEEVTKKANEQWWKGGIATEILDGAKAEWWDAEKYHQLYLDNNPGGYECPSHYVRKFPDLQ
ncbi:hypothetical protein LTR97_002220 [Elasticomyces elasticus]|uniref:peptide-methionine (S)-S-oxide reductase n=1 Tax=Elasticomyces elasticus TaxID=574655 RepID=A0AAN7WAD9_9PEZI|nr:hypothetical protein LTR97_002220 [Elasticomyces elasticus]